MEALIWIVFFVSLLLILLIARKSLWMAMFAGALCLGLYSPGIRNILGVARTVFTDPSILLLSLAVGIIPLIGGAMERTGMMDDLVNNLRMKKKAFLSVSPALVGLLPMPGGALLSAPLLEKGGKGVPNDLKSAINVWYRHIFILIYPLGTLLAITKMAGINLYVAVLYTVPGFLILLVLGHFTLIRKVEGSIEYTKKFDRNKLALALFVIVLAPVIHLCLMYIFGQLNVFPRVTSELPLVIGVTVSLIMAFRLGGLSPKDIMPVTRKMKPWNFALIIVGMFFFLEMFTSSDAPSTIEKLKVPALVLLVGVGFFLGAAMGRVTAPVFILYPIYCTQFGGGENATMPLIPFSVMYFAVFLGYVISPVHPCLIVTMEYFKVGYKEIFKPLMLPMAIALFIGIVAGALLL